MGKTFLKITPSNSKAILLAAEIALQNIKASLGVSSVINKTGRNRCIKLITASGNLIGSVQFTQYPFCYQVNQIQVSEPNLEKGIGRLLLLKAAVASANEGSVFIFPTYSFTKKGFASFGSYPSTPVSLINQKLPVAIGSLNEICDVPFCRAPVELPPPPTNYQFPWNEF